MVYGTGATTAHTSTRKYPYRRRPYTRSLAKKKVPVPAMRRTKKSLDRKQSMAINTLSRSVGKLKAASFGQKQYTRQTIRSLTQLPDQEWVRVTSFSPAAFCHQAISNNTSTWQVTFDSVNNEYITTNPGLLVEQPMPLLANSAAATRYDQLKYVKSNSTGVQPGYLHMSTSYEFLFKAVAWEGWVEVVHIWPRKQFTRQQAPQNDTWQLPAGLPAFCNTCLGDPEKYATNPSMFGSRVLKRMYFNTVAQVNPQQIHTNPQKSCFIHMKTSKWKAHIRAQKPLQIPETNPISSLDIPLHQQDWVLVRVSNPNVATAGSHLAVTLKRVPVWRDYFGNS